MSASRKKKGEAKLKEASNQVIANSPRSTLQGIPKTLFTDMFKEEQPLPSLGNARASSPALESKKQLAIPSFSFDKHYDIALVAHLDGDYKQALANFLCCQVLQPDNTTITHNIMILKAKIVKE